MAAWNELIKANMGIVFGTLAVSGAGAIGQIDSVMKIHSGISGAGALCHVDGTPVLSWTASQVTIDQAVICYHAGGITSTTKLSTPLLTNGTSGLSFQTNAIKAADPGILHRFWLSDKYSAPYSSTETCPYIVFTSFNNSGLPAIIGNQNGSTSRSGLGIGAYTKDVGSSSGDMYFFTGQNDGGSHTDLTKKAYTWNTVSGEIASATRAGAWTFPVSVSTPIITNGATPAIATTNKLSIGSKAAGIYPSTAPSAVVAVNIICAGSYLDGSSDKAGITGTYAASQLILFSGAAANNTALALYSTNPAAVTIGDALSFGNTLMTCTLAGAWSFGIGTVTPYASPAHITYANIRGPTPSASVDVQGGWSLIANGYASAAGSGSKYVGLSGVRLSLLPRTSDNNPCLLVYVNQAADGDVAGDLAFGIAGNGRLDLGILGQSHVAYGNMSFQTFGENKWVFGTGLADKEVIIGGYSNVMVGICSRNDTDGRPAQSFRSFHGGTEGNRMGFGFVANYRTGDGTYAVLADTDNVFHVVNYDKTLINCTGSGACSFGRSTTNDALYHTAYGSLFVGASGAFSSATYRWMGNTNAGMLMRLSGSDSYLVSGGYYNGSQWINKAANTAIGYFMLYGPVADASPVFEVYKITDSTASDYTFAAGTSLTTGTGLFSVYSSGATVLGTVNTTAAHTFNGATLDCTPGTADSSFLQTIRGSSTSRNALLGLKLASAYSGYIGASAANTYISGCAAGDMFIRAETGFNVWIGVNSGNTIGMKIASTGAVQIGVDSGTTEIVHSIYSYSSSSAALLVSQRSTALCLYLRNATTSSGFNAIWFVDGSNNLVGSITCNATADTTAYNTTSDGRLKHSERSFAALSLLRECPVLEYQRYSQPGVWERGYIAQKAIRYFPEAIHIGGDDVKTKPWMLDYGRVTPYLHRAIQELADDHDSTKKEIERLRSRIEQLERRLAA